MNPSELREALAMKYKAVVSDEWDFTDFLEHGLDSCIDSTLDAVIASLPPRKHNDKSAYTKALWDVENLLQSAKSTGKGSES